MMKKSEGIKMGKNLKENEREIGFGFGDIRLTRPLSPISPLLVTASALKHENGYLDLKKYDTGICHYP